MESLLVFMLVMCLSSGVVIGSPKLVIDHDGGADDAMALFMALLNEQYFRGPKVLALTTVHGNIPEHQAFVNAQRILDIAGRRDIPIYRGTNSSLVIAVPSNEFFGKDGLGDVPEYVKPIEAQPTHAVLGLIELTKKHPAGTPQIPIYRGTNSSLVIAVPSNEFFGKDGLGDVPEYVKPIEAQPTHAVLGLIELTKKHPGEITVITLGPLTNIALAVRLDPSFLSRLATLHVAIGRHEKNLKNYNINQDAEAYHVLVQGANPDRVTIIAYTHLINITKDWRINTLGTIPTKTMRALNSFERVSLPTQEWWLDLDPVAMAAVLNATVVKGVGYSKTSATLCGERRAMTNNIFTTKKDANVRVIREIDVPAYQAVLSAIFGTEAK